MLKPEIDPAVLALKPRALMRAFMGQPASFWALTIYIFFEYVRPQTIYPALDILPFARLSLLAAIGTALLESNGRRRFTLIDAGIILYAVVVGASLITAYDPSYGLDRVDLFLSWVVVYWLLSTTLNSQLRFFLLLLTWFLWNLKMSLFAVRSWAGIGFAFRDWGVGGAPGWFQNSGEFGIQMCVVFPLSLYAALGLRERVSGKVFVALLILPVTAAIGTIASSSRGALLGMAAIGVWMLLRSRYKVRGFTALAVVAASFLVLIPPEQMDRLTESGSDRTSQSRLTYWRHGVEIMNANPVLGIGYANWLPFYRTHYSETGELPHNFIVECMVELGYSGLVALLFLLVGTFVLNHRTRRASKTLAPHGNLYRSLAIGLDGALIGFVVSGFFVTVLYYPYLWVNLGMTTALHLSVLRSTKRTPGARALFPSQPSLAELRASRKNHNSDALRIRSQESGHAVDTSLHPHSSN